MIRTANISDHSVLTDIAFAAKKTWNYPSEFIELWQDELTITPEYITTNTVFVFEIENQIAGFISLIKIEKDKTMRTIFIEKGYWMDHLFIHPKYQKMGIGKQLTEHLLKFGERKNIKSLYIFVDPNAVGFYKKIGAEFIRNSDSSIPMRQLPVYAISTQR
jgi:GNAT superfamily N-acetyltransferase